MTRNEHIRARVVLAGTARGYDMTTKPGRDRLAEHCGLSGYALARAMAGHTAWEYTRGGHSVLTRLSFGLRVGMDELRPAAVSVDVKHLARLVRPLAGWGAP